MFKRVLSFEIYYQFKQRAFPLFLGLFLLLGFFVGHQGFAPQGINFNANYQVYFHTNVFTLGAVFIIMFFSVSGMLRDKQYQMESLIFSSPLKKSHYFWSRFIGVFMFSLLAFTPFLLGYYLGLSNSDLDPERLGDFKLMTFLQPWLYMVVPNIFICTSLIFSVCSLTKNNTATYVSAFFIYALYFISSLFLNSPMMAKAVPASPESMALAALVDPFGISAFFEQTQYWTPYQKNHELLSFSGLFMWNRMGWVALACGLLFVTYKLCSFRILNQRIKKQVPNLSKQMHKHIYTLVNPEFGFKTDCLMFWSLVKMEFRSVFRSLPFLVVFILWVGIVCSSLFSTVIEGGDYSDSVYPFTNILIELIVDPLTIFSLILIVFYSAELIWKERHYKFDSILDASPVSNVVFYLSKWIPILLLPIVLMVSGILLSIGFQVYLDYYNFQWSIYLSVFYFYGIQSFVFCMIAFFVHSILKNKYLGMGVFTCIVCVFMLAPLVGLEHPLLSLGFLPRPTYTNMNGYDGSVKLFNHLSIYWVALGGILTVMSFQLWQRGTEKKWLKLKVVFKSRRIQIGLFVVCSFGFVGGAGRVFYNTNLVNAYTTQEDQLDYRENYERKFKSYANLERLYPISMKTFVDLYPSSGTFQVEAQYILKNKGKNPISQVFITERIPLESIAFESANLVEYDSLYGTYVFEFNKAIQPQEMVAYSYKIRSALKGYETNKSVVENGTYLIHRTFEPFNYGSGLEIKDPMERKARGLPPREEEIENNHFHIDEAHRGRVDYETIVSTEIQQTALAPGELVKTWQKDQRTYFHYKPNTNIVPVIGYFSADYAHQKTTYKGIEIEQYYHKNHGFNIQTIEDLSKETLEYCQSQFGPYPYKTLRIAEIPAHWPFGGFAHAGLISMVEDRMYLTDIRDTTAFNLVAKRTIHEVAHQWWGHYLTPKNTIGGGLITEGFAKYTEAVVMDKLYGKAAVVQLGISANKRYFKGRSYASKPEPALYKEDGEGYLAYGKYFTVMQAIRELIGEPVLNQVLRNLTEKFGGQEEFNVTSLDFLEALYEVTPTKHHELLNDWLKRRIVYDLAIEESVVKLLDNGTFEVKIQLKSRRFKTLESGELEEISILEPLQIGVFTKHPRELSKEDSPLHLQFHKINKTQTEITVVVDQRPQFVSIDPFYTRSDENLIDNVLEIE